MINCSFVGSNGASKGTLEGGFFFGGGGVGGWARV